MDAESEESCWKNMDRIEEVIDKSKDDDFNEDIDDEDNEEEDEDEEEDRDEIPSSWNISASDQVEDDDDDDDDDMFYDEWSDALKQNILDRFLASRYDISDPDGDSDLDMNGENTVRNVCKVDSEEKDMPLSNVLSTTTTPNKDRYLQHLEEFIGPNAGSILIRGVTERRVGERDDNDDDDDDDDDEDEDYTDEQLNSCRHIILTPNRKKQLEKMESFANPNEGFFNSRTSNQIILGLELEVNRSMSKVLSSEKFDSLFALTYVLSQDSYWIYDNEFWEENDLLNQSIRLLAKAWRFLLKKPNAELGVDEEYTRPGIETLLEQFQEMISSCQYVNAKFKT